VRRALPHLTALILGVATALAIGCGADRSNLIPAGDAEALKAQLAQIRQDVADGNCEGLNAKIDQALSDAQGLPPNVDKRLRSRINQGVRALRDTAATDCGAAAAGAQTDTQPTETVPTDTTTQETTTQETTTQETTTQATPTTTTPTTTEPVPTTTEPPPTAEPTPPGDNGGTPGEVPLP
jgi:hypothetical protein